MHRRPIIRINHRMILEKWLVFGGKSTILTEINFILFSYARDDHKITASIIVIITLRLIIITPQPPHVYHCYYTIFLFSMHVQLVLQLIFFIRYLHLQFLW